MSGIETAYWLTEDMVAHNEKICQHQRESVERPHRNLSYQRLWEEDNLSAFFHAVRSSLRTMIDERKLIVTDRDYVADFDRRNAQRSHVVFAGHSFADSFRIHALSIV